jgi:hypothetical protein
MDKKLDNSKSIYENIVVAIVGEQREVIGPVALEQAGTVEGIEVSGDAIKITGKDPKKVIEDLVVAYAELFGRASVELSKEAVAELKDIPKDSLPKVLK